jgi:hypothetical protein
LEYFFGPFSLEETGLCIFTSSSYEQRNGKIPDDSGRIAATGWFGCLLFSG